MKVPSTVFAIALMLVGVVWTGQGANLIGGSFMTGQTTWLVIGLICILSGTLLLIWAHTGGRSDRHDDAD